MNKKYHGKLYISIKHICFYPNKKGTFSFGSDKKLWPLDKILDVEISNDKYIRIITVYNKKYLIGSLDDSLGKCFNTLQRHLFGVQGNSALHVAVQERNGERVKQILDLDPTKLCYCNKNELTPLTLAVVKNDLDMVELLLSYYEKNPDKCDINEGYGKTKNTILHTVCSLSDVNDEILHKIIGFPHIDVDTVNSDFNTPLHYFCERNHSLNCKKLGGLLISRSKDVKKYLSSLNRNKESILHKAVFNKKVRVFMVKMLINHKIELNFKNDQGETPLHYAVRLGREDLCELLLQAGADPLIKTDNNQTALDIANEIYMQDKTSESAAAIANIFKNVETLSSILNKAGLSSYFPQFIMNGLYDPYALIYLNKNQLENYNIDIKLGPQLKLFKEIEILKNNIEKEEEKKKKEKKAKPKLPLDDHDDVLPFDPEKTREDLGINDGEWEIDGSLLEFTKKLGSGASGKVYKGLYNGKEVAIKVLTAVDAVEQIDEFKKEFEILTSVRSPHIVKFYGASIEPKLSMVMEYCSRGSLYHVLNNNQLNLTWELSLDFCKQMAQGMNELHNWTPSPIVHRDLKSLNLLVTKDWRIKICDFGLSRFTGGNNLDTFKKLCGTFAYCAPEIFNGGSFTDRSDVYSMGIVIWEILNRTIKGKYEQPYSEFNLVYDFQIIVQASQGLRPTIHESTPSSLKELIQKCTHVDPNCRPTAKDVVKYLNEVIEKYKNEYKNDWDKLLPLDKENTESQKPV